VYIVYTPINQKEVTVSKIEEIMTEEEFNREISVEEERFHQRMSDEEIEATTRWWQEQIAKEELEIQKGFEELAKEEKRREKRIQIILLDWSKNHPLWTEVLGKCVELCSQVSSDWNDVDSAVTAEKMAVDCISFELVPTLNMASNFMGVPVVASIKEQSFSFPPF
jgi:hypothetical protein|tara:strand:- start:1777 stop:2274 length:498 start_codon:yes stop_codon:yes gene_type:complete